MNTQSFCLERELAMALQDVPSLDLRASAKLETLEEWEKRELFDTLTKLAALLTPPSSE